MIGMRTVARLTGLREGAVFALFAIPEIDHRVRMCSNTRIMTLCT